MSCQDYSGRQKDHFPNTLTPNILTLDMYARSASAEKATDNLLDSGAMELKG